MTRDLKENPLYKPEDLGKSLPDSPHAISVCLPMWKDVVGYEEGDERVLSKLQTPYPRFSLHHKVAQLFAFCEDKFAKNNEFAFVFPSKKTAQECSNYIYKNCALKCNIESLGRLNLFAIIADKSALNLAKEFWQHSGKITSSRLAEAFFGEVEFEPSDSGGSDSKGAIKQRIAGLSGQNFDDIYLFPSGAAAIFTAHQIISKLYAGKKTVQLGFPYLDTLKTQEKFGAGVHFLRYDEEGDLAALEELVEREEIAALFCEITGNPLLQTIDLERLSVILRAKNIPLIIDDTLATWFNVDIADYADIYVTSLSKFFSGAGDVLAGSLVINKKSPYYNKLKKLINLSHEDIFCLLDADILERNIGDFECRMKLINSNAEALCDYLNAHPKVKKVFYPKFVTKTAYHKIKRNTGGYGGLLSVELRNGSQATDFYNKLEFCKGPSLGNNFTLVCPYTLLAHYNELDYAEKNGVSRYLIRVSVGLERPEKMIDIFSRALD